MLSRATNIYKWIEQSTRYIRLFTRCRGIEKIQISVIWFFSLVISVMITSVMYTRHNYLIGCFGSVCLCVCEQYYSNRYERIALKIYRGVRNGKRKIWLHFGGNPCPLRCENEKKKHEYSCSINININTPAICNYRQCSVCNLWMTICYILDGNNLTYNVGYNAISLMNRQCNWLPYAHMR